MRKPERPLPKLLPESDHWDEESDVLVVGLGAAGACAALEAARAGASVRILERFNGGGATAISGGVVYAGGGTHIQREAGVEDSPENMFRYLREEVQGVVSDETLRRFCRESPGHLQWLADQGVPFRAKLCPHKTSYPTDDYFLYYSGSEFAHPFCEEARPAPRGHRTVGRGNSGGPLYAALRKAIERKGIPVYTQCKVQHLIADASGRILGVQVLEQPEAVRGRLAQLARRIKKLQYYHPLYGLRVHRQMEQLEQDRPQVRHLKARRGVILAAGGFVFNRAWVAKVNPRASKASPLGTTADDGWGIRLGQSAGGATAHMDRISVWRFYNPPEAFVSGILVDREGNRLCNEEYYGARIGDHIQAAGGTAWLLMDRAMVREAWRQLLPQTVFFQRLTAVYLLLAGHRKARTWKALARKTGLPVQTLAQTLAEYNRGAEAGRDALGKRREVLHPLTRPPFYAFDLTIGRSPFFPSPSITLGGLVVDETSGQVLREDGSPIPGLYAAGRNAVGICSASYVSGLSLADCVFSGRRAGRAAG